MIKLLRIVFFILISCSMANSSSKLRPIKISLEWLLNPHHAPFVIGIEKGFFKEAGLDVTLLNSIGSLEGCKQVSAQNIDFAITSEPQWIIQNSQGLDLKAICTLIPTPLEVFISRTPLSDLRGKRIGHCSSGVSFSMAVLKEILQKQNIDISEIELIYTRHALNASFISRQVDAVTNLYRTYGVTDLRQHGQDFYVYPLEDIGIPTFSAMILVSHSKLPPEIGENLFLALRKSCEFLKNNPKEAWNIFQRYQPELNIPMNAEVWEKIIPLFEIEKISTDGLHHKALRTFLKKYDLIEN